MLTLAIHALDGLLEGLSDRPDPSNMTCVLLRNGDKDSCEGQGLTRLCAPCTAFHGLRKAQDALKAIKHGGNWPPY